MIPVTRLNGSTLWVSSDQIEFIEATPDSVISLVSGKRVIASEKPEELIKRIVEFKRRIFTEGPAILVDKQGKESGGPDDVVR